MAMPPAKNNFDVEAFLANIGQDGKIARVRKKSRVYAQGDACDAVFYIISQETLAEMVASTRSR
jgi:hypothetical protein